MARSDIRGLSTTDLRVLAAAEHRALATDREIARTIRSTAATVRYSLQKLSARGILRDRRPFIDISKCGLFDTTFFIIMKPETRSNVSSLRKELESTPAVYWLAETAGTYDLIVSVFARSPQDAFAHLQSAIATSVKEVSAIEVTYRLAQLSFGRRYLAGDPKLSRELGYRIPGKSVPLDEMDWKILRELANTSWDSFAGIAKRLKQPATTVARRIRNLEEQGVIVGYRYTTRMYDVGFSISKIALRLGQISPEAYRRVEEFARRQKNVTSCFLVLGPWQVELSVETAKSSELQACLREIHSELAGIVKDIVILPLLDFGRQIALPV